MKEKHIIKIIKKDESSKIIILGGIHGNEDAGIHAMNNVIKTFNKKDILKKGNIYFLKGNIQAIKNKERFLDKDLNRLWLDKYIFSKTSKIEDVKPLKELHNLIYNKICKGNFNNCILLDLHTFSAKSGIFCIPTSNKKSVDLAASFRIPFIEKLSENLPGTALSYFGKKGMISLVLEGGTHGTTEAIDNLEAGIWHTLAYLGFIENNCEKVVKSHNKLIELGKHYPYHLELSYRHQLKNSHDFLMNNGYYNFKQIKKDENLAIEKNKPVKSPSSGFMLMPLYQKKGSDGFFIVKEIKNVYNKNNI